MPPLLPLLDALSMAHSWSNFSPAMADRTSGTFRAQLHTHFASYGEAAGRCDLDAAEMFLPELPIHVKTVLRETRAYVRDGKPEKFSKLRDCYQKAEVTRKTARSCAASRYRTLGPKTGRMGPRSAQYNAIALSLVHRSRHTQRPKWSMMKSEAWPTFSFTEVLSPPEGWRTDCAILSTYSADLVVIVTALLALTGCDLDNRRTGSRVELVKAIEALRGRVRVLAQTGRMALPSIHRPILKLLDRFVKIVDADENISSWHPKAALVRYQNVDDISDRQWRVWLGSRNLTRALNWEAGLVLASRSDGKGQHIEALAAFGQELAARARLAEFSLKTSARNSRS